MHKQWSWAILYCYIFLNSFHTLQSRYSQNIGDHSNAPVKDNRKWICWTPPPPPLTNNSMANRKGLNSKAILIVYSITYIGYVFIRKKSYRKTIAIRQYKQWIRNMLIKQISNRDEKYFLCIANSALYFVNYLTTWIQAFLFLKSAPGKWLFC